MSVRITGQCPTHFLLAGTASCWTSAPTKASTRCSRRRTAAAWSPLNLNQSASAGCSPHAHAMALPMHSYGWCRGPLAPGRGMSSCRAARACVLSCTHRLHPAGAFRRSFPPPTTLSAPLLVRCFLRPLRCDWQKWTRAEAVDLWPLCGPTVHGAWLRCVPGRATQMCPAN